VTIAGPEGLLPVSRLFDRAGAAARGVLIATAIRPAANGEHPYAVLARTTVDVALNALGRSNATRPSMARSLRVISLRTSPIGPIAFDEHGDLRRAPVTILRAQRPGGSRTNMSLEGGSVVTIVR
jgi:ABC-type branched-subunit amino acid transport system substrate-binding protein